MRIIYFLAFAILLLPGLVSADWAGFDAPYEEPDKAPWEELQEKLPPYPAPPNQQEFYVSGVVGNHYFVDRSSLHLGKDGVVRYVLTVKTRGGAKNVSFEGIRCETRERKIYAIGQTDGTWTRAQNSQWQPIASRSSLSYRRPLADTYFCPMGIMVNTPQQALQNIRNAW